MAGPGYCIRACKETKSSQPLHQGRTRKTQQQTLCYGSTSQHSAPSSVPVGGKLCGAEGGARKSEEIGRKFPSLCLVSYDSVNVIFILPEWSSATWFRQPSVLSRLQERPNSCKISWFCAKKHRTGSTESQIVLALCWVLLSNCKHVGFTSFGLCFFKNHLLPWTVKIRVRNSDKSRRPCQQMSTTIKMALEQIFPYRAPVLDFSSRLPGASEVVFLNFSNNCKTHTDFYLFHCKPEARLMVCFYCCFFLQLLIWTSRMSSLSAFFLFSYPLIPPLKTGDVQLSYKSIFFLKKMIVLQKGVL